MLNRFKIVFLTVGYFAVLFAGGLIVAFGIDYLSGGKIPAPALGLLTGFCIAMVGAIVWAITGHGVFDEFE